MHVARTTITGLKFSDTRHQDWESVQHCAPALCRYSTSSRTPASVVASLSSNFCRVSPIDKPCPVSPEQNPTLAVAFAQTYRL